MRSFLALLGRLWWRVRRLVVPQQAFYVPGYEGYGGATITRRRDGSGAEWIGCCARQQSDGYFGFFVFKNGVNVPISPRCSGRGTLHDDGYWIAWEGSTKYSGPIPGFVPLPASSGGGSGGDGSAPMQIPPGSPITQLWRPDYTSAEVDSPEEVAIKFNKLKAAVFQIIDMHVSAGEWYW